MDTCWQCQGGLDSTGAADRASKPLGVPTGLPRGCLSIVCVTLELERDGKFPQEPFSHEKDHTEELFLYVLVLPVHLS